MIQYTMASDMKVKKYIYYFFVSAFMILVVNTSYMKFPKFSKKPFRLFYKENDTQMNLESTEWIDDSEGGSIEDRMAEFLEEKKLNAEDKSAVEGLNGTTLDEKLYENLPVGPWDDILLKNLYNSTFIEPQKKICPDNGQHKRVIIAVSTSPESFEKRMAIRDTWGSLENYERDMTIGFFIGQTNNENITKRIYEENKKYEDVIMLSNYESYENLTLKTVSMIQWVSEFCNMTQFILKIDEDVYINLEMLREFIFHASNDPPAIYGMLARQWKPVRCPRNRYYISKRRYSREYLPTFVLGPAYLIPGKYARELYETSLITRFFKLEDVFLTGIVAGNLGINRYHLKEFKNDRKPPKALCKWREYLSVHRVGPRKMRKVWRQKYKKCRTRFQTKLNFLNFLH